MNINKKNKILSNFLIFSNSTIEETINKINNNDLKFLFVIDKNNSYLGLLKENFLKKKFDKKILNEKIENLFNKKELVQLFIDIKMNYYEIKKIINKANKEEIPFIPIIENQKIIDIIVINQNFDEFNKNKNKVKVVIMAGGLGTRLRPLTNNTPKPLLKINNTAIIDIIIENFKNLGYKNFIISINYLYEKFLEHFKNRNDINIEFIIEKEKLGTAGSLSLMDKVLSDTFFVINGDIITNLNFNNLLNYHLNNNNTATMVTRKYEITIPFGVIETNYNNDIIDIIEKPTYYYKMNSGIYVLNKEILNFIEENKYLDMPDLFKILKKERKKIKIYDSNSYWIDIGRLEEYEKAQKSLYKIFKCKDIQ